MIKRILTASFVAIVACSHRAPSEKGNAQADASPATLPATVAMKGIDKLHHFVDTGRAARLAGSVTKTMDGASLGNPTSVFRVDVERLKSYQAGSNPRSLFVDDNRTLYPVIVAGEVRSAVTVARGPTGEFVLAGVGLPTLARQLDAVERRAAENRGVPTEFSLIEIRALHIRLLSYEDDGRIMLIPFRTIDQTSIKKGEALEAHDVFAELQHVAENFKK